MVSMKKYAVRVTPVLAALALSACTVVPYQEASDNSRSEAYQPADATVLPETADAQQTLVVPQQPKAYLPATSAATSLPAAQRMRQLASAEGEKGEYRSAVALLERALRISPRDPETYYELARNHLLLDNPAQAMQLAQRGLSHSPNADQRARLEQLVEDCRAALTA